MKRLSQILLVIACALPVTGKCFAAQDSKLPADERLEALNKETRDVYDTWAEGITARARAAEAKGEELPRSAYTPPFKPFVAKYQAAAKDYAGTDDAIPFLTWLVRQGMDIDAAAGKEAMATLVDDHLKSEKFEWLASLLPIVREKYEEKDYLALLRKVETNTTSPVVRAWAVLSRLSDTLDDSAVGSEAFEAAKKAIEKNKLNWRSFQNQPEGSEGKISGEWYVSGWPTIVVLDAERKVRYRGHDGMKATKVAKKLVKELQMASK